MTHRYTRTHIEKHTLYWTHIAIGGCLDLKCLPIFTNCQSTHCTNIELCACLAPFRLGYTIGVYWDTVFLHGGVDWIMEKWGLQTQPWREAENKRIPCPIPLMPMWSYRWGGRGPLQASGVLGGGDKRADCPPTGGSLEPWTRLLALEPWSLGAMDGLGGEGVMGCVW